MKMSECRNTGENVSPASLVLALVRGVSPSSASASVRYRWSRIIPVVPSYGYHEKCLFENSVYLALLKFAFYKTNIFEFRKFFNLSFCNSSESETL
jgi:hypothetical protein